uniref:Uncharacterized protein n=1 Tax=Ipomoea trifida TaxID=35884 RepID=A0PAC4_IPOTF|nr:hypothetical protein [Ipomoea trifida]
MDTIIYYTFTFVLFLLAHLGESANINFVQKLAPIELQIRTTLKAPANPNDIDGKKEWIIVQYIDHFTLSGGGTLDGQGNVQVYDAKDKGFKSNNLPNVNPNLPSAIFLFYQFVAKPMLSLNFSARTGSPQLNTITLGDKIPMPIDLPDPTLNGLARNQHSCVPIGKTDDRPGACGARGEYAERPTCAPS